VERRRREK